MRDRARARDARRSVAIAVGRTFESDRPNMAVGILSAVDRIWGKALQTDAAASPNNYGGPLVDIRGRVMGILVPLSPDAAGGVAGMEWYDSGIGFAIPLEHIRQVLPRLEKREDLHPGLAGVNLKGPNLYTGPAVIAACHPKCPATSGGIKAGDQIVAIDGRPVTRAAEVKQEIGRRYAGDKMRLTVLRGKERLECEIELAAKLEPFQHGFLGVLPMRTAEEKGVPVRYVYPQSPAATTGIVAGDTLISLDGKPIRDRLDLIEKIGAWNLERRSKSTCVGTTPCASSRSRSRGFPKSCRRRNCRRRRTFRGNRKPVRLAWDRFR